MITDVLAEIPASAYLWHDRSLYIGHITPDCRLCTHAPALALFIDRPGEVACEGKQVLTDAVLIQANQSIRVNARGGRVAAMFLDPLGKEYRRLIPRMMRHGNAVHFDLQSSTTLAAFYDEVQTTKACADVVMLQLNEWLGPREPLTGDEQRIRAVLHTIKRHTCDNLSSQRLADMLNVSDAHLMRMFKKTVGIPLRRYRNWHRLAAAAQLWLTRDINISHAALSVGFSDTPHFNRYFKQSLGMSPGFLLGFNRPVDLFVDKPGSGPWE